METARVFVETPNAVTCDCREAVEVAIAAVLAATDVRVVRRLVVSVATLEMAGVTPMKAVALPVRFEVKYVLSRLMTAVGLELGVVNPAMEPVATARADAPPLARVVHVGVEPTPPETGTWPLVPELPLNRRCPILAFPEVESNDAPFTNVIVATPTMVIELETFRVEV